MDNLVDDAYLDDLEFPLRAEMAGVPLWAIWLFIACSLVTIAVLILDYCVIRRNALGNSCCTRTRTKLTVPSQQKRSTNMLLNKLNRQAFSLHSDGDV